MYWFRNAIIYQLTKQTDSKFKFHLVRLVTKILGRQENILWRIES